MTQKLRWGIIGCAQIATGSVMPAIQESETGIIAAVASRGLEKSSAVAAEFGIGKAYGSYEELLADEEIDAVYIPLPNHLHRQWVIRAAEAGKHVLCEKPIALNSTEAAEMVEACRKAGVHLAEAYMYRHHPRIAELREIISRGDIGELRSIRGTFTYNDAGDTSNIRFKSAWGGGSLYDVGCYPLSAARLLFGAEPEAVTVQAIFSPEHDNVDMMASGLVEFPGGVSLIFDCGMWAYNRQLLEVLGTEGRIEIPMPFNARFEDAEFFVHTGGEVSRFATTGANPYVRQADNFAAAVFGDKPLVADDDPVQSMKLIEACLESARRRERISLL
ncbi:dTDP-3,4-didehydro-2,6-dideoxy-alpha-D-glucose 3-reductase [Paenibacillus auburnensis]|uniref:dTDP-3,4-didehydro-2,6-dideoxy-alpha-D-glucose 3-reductase n=1 Tax=Paenibacillus auburnensis TaxID=2905649 RepID=A0ABM9CE40_9BACL|nr:Gfo/Idh/MocA family oxidoreductase [Paenibacillus auburnensis]CAH1210026.1 dTDP-3,4-didehydro-2,6-dideoxy-alpha-D-glucose 3-reductase [Paenibacillus auburnensis]